ncbi:hypothetical protein BGZ94_000220 [Podila epigama]|nr:hypothetical protein BGZ94_000220 [Podila epigama]
MTRTQEALYETPSRQGPKVLIVGAGIGGLALAIFLKKGGIPFMIFERAKEMKPFGSAMSVGVTIRSLLEQVGLYKDLQNLGKPYHEIKIFNKKLKQINSLDYSRRTTMGGGQEYIVSRPDLHAMLVQEVGAENILLGKKVLAIKQGSEAVTLRCSDNSYYEGDIIVGADGAYSAVRQQLYKSLRLKKALPGSDNTDLPSRFVCLIGQTKALDPEEFTRLKEPETQERLTKQTTKINDAFRASEWGPEAAEAMFEAVRHIALPHWPGEKPLFLGDLIDRSPEELVSKVMLEEKLFKTWYGGRSVLLGDGNV